jgi:hypothetical protein
LISNTQILKNLLKTKKVYLNGEQFNFYHLKPGMEIIILVTINKLWDNGIINYHFSLNEMVIKKII